jgi:hypothetical protein
MFGLLYLICAAISCRHKTLKLLGNTAKSQVDNSPLPIVFEQTLLLGDGMDEVKIKSTSIGPMFVSSCGRVFLELRQHGRSQGMRYRSVSFEGEKYDVHRLVAQVYIPNPESKPLVMHLDDNPSNNRVENLRWGTYQDNSDDMVSKGRHLPGIEKRKRLLVSKRLLLGGLKTREIAKILGVSPSYVSLLIREHRDKPQNPMPSSP